MRIPSKLTRMLLVPMTAAALAGPVLASDDCGKDVIIKAAEQHIGPTYITKVSGNNPISTTELKIQAVPRNNFVYAQEKTATGSEVFETNLGPNEELLFSSSKSETGTTYTLVGVHNNPLDNNRLTFDEAVGLESKLPRIRGSENTMFTVRVENPTINLCGDQHPAYLIQMNVVPKVAGQAAVQDIGSQQSKSLEGKDRITMLQNGRINSRFDGKAHADSIIAYSGRTQSAKPDAIAQGRQVPLDSFPDAGIPRGSGSQSLRGAPAHYGPQSQGSSQSLPQRGQQVYMGSGPSSLRGSPCPAPGYSNTAQPPVYSNGGASAPDTTVHIMAIDPRLQRTLDEILAQENRARPDVPVIRRHSAVDNSRVQDSSRSESGPLKFSLDFGLTASNTDREASDGSDWQPMSVSGGYMQFEMPKPNSRWGVRAQITGSDGLSITGDNDNAAQVSMANWSFMPYLDKDLMIIDESKPGKKGLNITVPASVRLLLGHSSLNASSEDPYMLSSSGDYGSSSETSLLASLGLGWGKYTGSRVFVRPGLEMRLLDETSTRENVRMGFYRCWSPWGFGGGSWQDRELITREQHTGDVHPFIEGGFDIKQKGYDVEARGFVAWPDKRFEEARVIGGDLTVAGTILAGERGKMSLFGGVSYTRAETYLDGKRTSDIRDEGMHFGLRISPLPSH
jgi:hypothetical protein